MCKTSQTGEDYTGDISVTVNAKTCQRWPDQSPHSHSYNHPNYFQDATLADASNYCRNPLDPDGVTLSDSLPWCYTVDPDDRWEYCDIPFCGN